MRIGILASTAGFVVCVVYIFLTQVTTRFGTTSVAALEAGHKVQSIAFMIRIEASVAVTTIVG